MLLENDLIVPDWPAPANVRALSTTRAGGISVGSYANLNLGDHVADDPAAVAENRTRLRRYLPAEPVWLKQVHRADVADADRASSIPEADAAVARRVGAVCAVLTADCLPVLFCDHAGSVVAAAHAGWRGLAGGVVEAAVAAMEVAPETVLAWLGPAIGPAAFEVGGEVREAFLAQNPAAEAAFAAQPEGKWLADIFLLARLRLQKIGVTAIYGGGVCTYTDATRFYSYRRDGATGRMASLVWRE